jgi:hypothetical protein
MISNPFYRVGNRFQQKSRIESPKLAIGPVKVSRAESPRKSDVAANTAQQANFPMISSEKTEKSAKSVCGRRESS